MTKETFEIESKQISDVEKKRIDEAYAQLLCQNKTGVALKPNQEWIPAWSSYGLEQLIEKTLSSPKGCISDLFLGFWKALDETNAPLTKPMCHFIKDMIVYSWLNYRWRDKPNKKENFDWSDFEWIVPLVNKGCTKAQAYLAVFVLNYFPIEMAKCKGTILNILKKSDFIEEHKGYYLILFDQPPSDN
ncbi:MAG: hypothetical protein ACOH2E_05935 [Candidatus Paracaedibacter sp.]